MKCRKCQGRMVYEAPTYEGEQGSARCLNCGNRIWEPPKVVMPDVPVLEKDRSYAANATNLQKAREAKRQPATVSNEILVNLARIEKQARLAVA